MTDIPKQCKALFDKLMAGEITHKEFAKQIEALEIPKTETIFSGKSIKRSDWGDEEN